MKGKSPIISRSQRNFKHKENEMHVGSQRGILYKFRNGTQIPNVVEIPVCKSLSLYWDTNSQAFIHWEPLVFSPLPEDPEKRFSFEINM